MLIKITQAKQKFSGSSVKRWGRISKNGFGSFSLQRGISKSYSLFFEIEFFGDTWKFMLPIITSVQNQNRL